MTAPAGDVEDSAAAGIKLRRGQLVTFAAKDPILGGEYFGAGVVVATGDADGDPVTIRPLAPHAIQVGPDFVQPASADEVGV